MQDIRKHVEPLTPAIHSSRARVVAEDVIDAMGRVGPGLNSTAAMQTFYDTFSDRVSGTIGIRGQPVAELATATAVLAQQFSSRSPERFTSVSGAIKTAVITMLTAPADSLVWIGHAAYRSSCEDMQRGAIRREWGRERKKRAWQRFADAQGRELAIGLREHSRTWVRHSLEHFDSLPA